MRDDLVLGLLNQDQFAELIGLMRRFRIIATDARLFAPLKSH